MEYIINTDTEQDSLLAKSGADVQAVLENKIEELVNQGRKVRHDEVAEAYEKADEVIVSDEEQVLIEKSGQDFQALLESKKDEVVKHDIHTQHK